MANEIEALADKAVRSGWRKERTNGNHFKLTSPQGEVVVYSPRGTSRHHLLNFKKELERKGYVENYIPEKDKVVYRSPDPEPDPAIAAAKAIDERKQAQDHTVSGATRRLLRENPGRSYSVDEAYMIVKARMPDATKINVAQTLSTGVTKGDFVRAGRGMYKYVNGVTAQTKPPEAPEPQPASPKPVKMTTGDQTIDQMLEKIDQALLALGEIEEVVSWVQERMNKLAEFKKALGG